VDREEDQARRLVRALEVARRFAAQMPACDQRSPLRGVLHAEVAGTNVMNALDKKRDALPYSTLPSQDPDASVSITAREMGYVHQNLGQVNFSLIY
jgi:hypothetical protein